MPALSSGLSSYLTDETLASSAIFNALSFLSPVSITVSRPISFKSFIARGEVSLTSSMLTSPSTDTIPLVIVPVLSKTTVSVFFNLSRLSALLKRMPFFAPMPIPTVIATGVASPSAQGQEITSTQIPFEKAVTKSLEIMNHTANVIIAMTIITGTKMPEILSASLAIGALVAPASLVILTIFIRVDSSPTPSAFTLT